MPARMMKLLAGEIAPVLTSIFRQSLASGNLPSDWTKAFITPVFKKGDRSSPANYRPVSLTCIASKLMEHILCTHIRGHLDHHQILAPENHGFRSRHSCETQLQLTTHDLLKRRDSGKQIDVAILDFSKAFDTVPHKRLLGKMEQFGITGDLHRWISAFLIGRKQAVVVDGERSDEEDVLSGVPQGTVLGPLLFLLHINDLPHVLHPDTRCRLFADDCLLYRTVDGMADHLKLQQDLKSLEQWAATWGMRFNASKCYVMSIYRGRSHSTHMYELCDVFLSSVENEKYLGVNISQDLSWDPHISRTAITASQKLGYLKRNLKGCPAQLKKLAYLSSVRSSLEYAAIIWDPHLDKHKTMLESVQRKAARWITNDHRRTSSVTAMLQSLQLDTLEERRKVSRLTFMYKIINNHVAVPMADLGLERNPRATRGLATRDKLVVPRCSTTELQQHFVSRTIPDWNRLPQSTTSADSVPSFKSQLSRQP